MRYNLEILVKETRKRISKFKVTKRASNDWIYNFNDGYGWNRPVLRVTRADHTIRIIVQEHYGPWHCDVYFNGVRIFQDVDAASEPRLTSTYSATHP